MHRGARVAALACGKNAIDCIRHRGPYGADIRTLRHTIFNARHNTPTTVPAASFAVAQLQGDEGPSAASRIRNGEQPQNGAGVRGAAFWKRFSELRGL
jgi:hypothetical protein